MGKGFFRIVLWLALAASSTAQPANEVRVPFHGTNFVHLDFHGVADQPNDVRLILWESGPDFPQAALASDNEPPLETNGTLRRDFAWMEQRSYTLIAYAKDPQNPTGPLLSRVLAETTAYNTTTSVWGVPARDDTLSADLVGFDHVEIPAGRTLTVSANVVGGTITVRGKLVLPKDIECYLTAEFYTPHELSGLHTRPSAFTFRPGSEGSVVDGGSNHTVLIHADDIKVQNSQQDQVHIYKGTSIELGWIEDLTLGMYPGAGNVVADNCKFMDTPDIQAPETLEQRPVLNAYTCEFKNNLLVSNTVGLNLQNSKIEGTVRVGRVTGSTRDPAKQTFSNCFIGGIFVMDADARFTQCEIGPDLYLQPVNLGSCRSLVFKQCIFASSVTLFENWVPYNGSPPEFTNSSFLGPYAVSASFIPTTSIPLGANYYGDNLGPTLLTTAGPTLESFPFLSNRGAGVSSEYFQVAPYQQEGEERAPGGRFPQFWLAGYIAGQNTIPHADHGKGSPLRRDRDTLISLEIVCTDNEVKGATVWAEANGVRIGEPVSPILYRDANKAPSGSHGGRFQGSCATDLVIPPLDKDQVTVNVFLDTRGVTGYQTNLGSVTHIAAIPLKFDAGTARRPLRFVVMPVQLWIPFYPSQTPDADAVAARLDGETPEMFPIRGEDLQVSVGRPYRFTGRSLGSVAAYTISRTALLNMLGAELKCGEVFLNTTSCVAGAGQSLDYVVAALANGALGAGVEGNSFALRRSVIFVNEQNPEAAWHEMGHAYGLYNAWGGEQYQLFPDNGLPVGGVTSFLGEGKTQPKGFYSKGRLLHWPKEDDKWFKKRNRYDIMGDRPECWPILTTMDVFHRNLVQTLDGYGAARQEASLALNPYMPIQVPIQSGYRRIQLWGHTQPVVMGTSRTFMIVPESVQAFNTTPINNGWIGPPDSSSEGMPYDVRGYNAQGSLVYTATTWSVPSQAWGDTPPERDIWIYTADIPPWITRLEVALPQVEPFFSVEATPALTCHIATPASGSFLNPGTQASWDIGGNPRNQWTLPLISTDGGQTWEAMELPIEGDSLDAPFDRFPASDNVSFRVLVSDGINVAEDRVDGLRIPNRAPRVTIHQPPDGGETPPGTPIHFSGSAWDVEDSVLDRFSWTSSLDGDLGNSPTLSGIALSPGDHVITCAARDSQGLEGSARITLHVREMEKIDLALDRSDLGITGGREGIHDTRSPVLVPGKPHSISLRVRNTGIGTTVTLALSVTPPVGPSQILEQSEFQLEPFGSDTMEVSYLPQQAGHYLIRGVLLNSNPADRNPANDTVEVDLLGGHSPSEVRDAILGLRPPDPDTHDANDDGVIDIADGLNR